MSDLFDNEANDVTQEVITRQEWGARLPKRRKALKDTTSPTLHWNGPSTGLDEHSSRDDEIRMLKGVQKFHMVDRGWADIAYSFAFAPSGRVYELRGWKIRTAANGTSKGNSASHAFFLMVGDGDPIPQEMIDSVRRMRAIGDSKYVKAHRDWKATACPGQEITKLIRAGAFEGLPERDKTVEPVKPIDVLEPVKVETVIERPDTSALRLHINSLIQDNAKLKASLETALSMVNDLDNFKR